jgi:hypothetical protein
MRTCVIGFGIGFGAVCAVKGLYALGCIAIVLAILVTFVE